MRRTLLWMVVLCLAGCGSKGLGPTKSGTARPDAEPKTTAGNTDVTLTIADYAGILQQIAANHGKVVVMDAWSTSCPPCMKEFHNLVELHKKYGSERLACMSLSFDYEGLGKPEDVRGRVLRFLQSQGATFDNLMSNEESDTLYRKFKLAAVPAVFVYDRDGKLRKRFDNERAKTAAEAFTYEQVGAARCRTSG